MASIETLNFGDNVEYVPAMAFSKVPTLTHVKLGKGVKHIGEGAFLQDEGITEIELPDALEKSTTMPFLLRVSRIFHPRERDISGR